ncbi:hypothetical protein Tco_0366801 [Tanacetum coccineum]
MLKKARLLASKATKPQIYVLPVVHVLLHLSNRFFIKRSKNKIHGEHNDFLHASASRAYHCLKFHRFVFINEDKAAAHLKVHHYMPKHYLPNIIRFCGKLEIDRLLPKLKAKDHWKSIGPPIDGNSSKHDNNSNQPTGPTEKPMIDVNYKVEEKTFAAEGISSMKPRVMKNPKKHMNNVRDQKVVNTKHARHNKMQGIEGVTDQVPIRRTQKLPDKIIAFEKLVSPYGKTNTTSMLQEAHISINLLYDQI